MKRTQLQLRKVIAQEVYFFLRKKPACPQGWVVVLSASAEVSGAGNTYTGRGFVHCALCCLSPVLKIWTQGISSVPLETVWVVCDRREMVDLFQILPLPGLLCVFGGSFLAKWRTDLTKELKEINVHITGCNLAEDKRKGSSHHEPPAPYLTWRRNGGQPCAGRTSVQPQPQIFKRTWEPNFLFF